MQVMTGITNLPSYDREFLLLHTTQHMHDVRNKKDVILVCLYETSYNLDILGS